MENSCVCAVARLVTCTSVCCTPGKCNKSLSEVMHSIAAAAAANFFVKETGRRCVPGSQSAGSLDGKLIK